MCQVVGSKVKSKVELDIGDALRSSPVGNPTFDPTTCHINIYGPVRHKKKKFFKSGTLLSNGKVPL